MNKSMLFFTVPDDLPEIDELPVKRNFRPVQSSTIHIDSKHNLRAFDIPAIFFSDEESELSNINKRKISVQK